MSFASSDYTHLNLKFRFAALLTLTTAIAAVLGAATTDSEQARISSLMPRVGDHTSMWWRDGFPGHVAGADWIRRIRTGHYALAINTETLEIPHLGPVPTVSYEESARTEIDWSNLGFAKLKLRITANGKTYTCSEGGKWTRFTGPRLIVSGRFLQRADITNLRFSAPDGEPLNAEARLEAVAWPDRLGFVLAARPGRQPIVAGEASFGRVNGGYGFDGNNHLQVPHSPELDPEEFTLELWAFIPADHQAHERAAPWLVCKNQHEAADGNYGIAIQHGLPQARLNIGGGRENQFTAKAESRSALKLNAWNHLAMSYDGETLRLFVNGREVADTHVGRQRIPGRHPLVFGRRLADSNRYCFRGVLDEIRIYDRALSPQDLRHGRQSAQPVAEWTFREEGQASATQPRERWKDVALSLQLETPKGRMGSSASLWMDPVSFEEMDAASPVTVEAVEIPTQTSRPTGFDTNLNCHRINLDRIEPIVPDGETRPSNNAIERVKLSLTNPTDREEIARLLFEKTAHGIRQRMGTPITGISAVLRDLDGNPTGIPVQLSKNWHNDPEGGPYSGQWFHGVSLVRLPPRSSTELELTLVYGHWGGLPAASHSQLSLIGWGGNQLWEQSALGSWGESICFDPEQAQTGNTITDVRPLMVRSFGRNERWGWTVNVGGGDFFRLSDASGKRVPHASMRTTYHRQGPCLTEVGYAGRIGRGISHSITVSLARGDDLTRGIYRIRMDVSQATDFSRFVLFQIGADTYSSTAERRFAVGDQTGLAREWETQWGGNTYRTAPARWAGAIPWASLHESVRAENQPAGAWANRGLVLRRWKARLGGENVAPWFAERGLTRHSKTSSTFDILPPPGLTRLEPGDYIEATIEHLVIPKSAADYYGPNQGLRDALGKHADTWRMIHREAAGNDRRIEMKTGHLLRRHPDIRIRTTNNVAELKLTGGIGCLPITFTDLGAPQGWRLIIDGRPLDQSVHGNDFWQTDYDPVTKRWTATYNLPALDDFRTIRFETARKRRQRVHR